MSDALERLHQMIDALEADPSWIWPPIDRSVSREETKMNRHPHDPRDLSFADRVYSQVLPTSIDENEAREKTYKHLVIVHQWQDDRAKHASALAMEIE